MEQRHTHFCLTLKMPGLREFAVGYCPGDTVFLFTSATCSEPGRETEKGEVCVCVFTCVCFGEGNVREREREREFS